MPAKTDPYYADLRQLLPAALAGDKRLLETYLTERSNLPGPRMNTRLVGAFADFIGELVMQPDPPVAQLEALLDGWASLPLENAPVNHPREMLPAVAALSYSQVAVARPDWWEDEIGKLHQAALNPRWRMREIVALALQRMLKADWQRSYNALTNWVAEDDALVIRAAAAGIAEPPLLTDRERGDNALTIQSVALAWLANLPPERRHDEAVEVLRKALGYTLSVAVAATPESGFVLLEKLSASNDKDIRWILRENFKKKRLAPWQARLNELEARL